MKKNSFPRFPPYGFPIHTYKIKILEPHSNLKYFPSYFFFASSSSYPFVVKFSFISRIEFHVFTEPNYLYCEISSLIRLSENSFFFILYIYFLLPGKYSRSMKFLILCYRFQKLFCSFPCSLVHKREWNVIGIVLKEKKLHSPQSPCKMESFRKRKTGKCIGFGKLLHNSFCFVLSGEKGRFENENQRNASLNFGSIDWF